jgi:hypothetical protein
MRIPFSLVGGRMRIMLPSYRQCAIRGGEKFGEDLLHKIKIIKQESL